MIPIKPIINLPNSSSGQKNTPDLVDFDRISALPDSILGVILSYLPTKNAVATSILSRRWEFVWMTVHNLDFCGPYRRGNDENEKFVQFVNRVLLLHDGGLLNRFRLIWGISFIRSQVSSWITTAITRNIHELFLCVEDHWGKPLELPISLFSCDSLQSLELSGSISVSAANVVCLPRLESLKLVSVYFQSEETFQKLIRCPMLKYLHVDLDITKFTRHVYNYTYRISSPSLRGLDVCNSLWGLNYTCNLELETSSLEYLKLDGFIAQVFVQGSLSSLVEADFGIILPKYKEKSYNSLAKGIRYFDCAKAVTLSPHVMLALSNATISLSTKFSRLTKLKAEVVCCYCSSLLDFIQSSDSLQVLTIYKETSYDPVEYDHDHDHSNWITPVEVPKCLSNSLKEASFEGYSGSDDEREMISYLLKHGSALEVMKFSCFHYNFKDEQIIELVKEIRRFPRKSPACELEYIE